MKTALEILNEVEPNGELLDTDKAIIAMEKYAEQWKYNFSKSCKCDNSIGTTWCCNLCGMPRIDIYKLST